MQNSKSITYQCALNADISDSFARCFVKNLQTFKLIVREEKTVTALLMSAQRTEEAGRFII